MLAFFYNRSTRWYLTAITLLGLFVRMVRAIIDCDIKQDAVLYMDMARVWIAQGADAATQLHRMIPPLWPWVLGTLHSVGIEPEISGQVIGVLLGTTAILSVYIISRTVFEQESYALIAALLVAIHPYLIRLSAEMLRDTVYIPLVALALALATSATVNSKWWKWALYGVVCALAVMTRREGGELMVFLSCWSVIELIQKRAEFKYALQRVAVANVVSYVALLAVAYPVQCKMSMTQTSWRIIPRELDQHIQLLFTVSEEDLFKTIQDK